MMFKCPHCLYRSDKKHLYLGHIRSHTGEKPFKCRYCDYRCAQSGNRLVHERRMHEFHKPYKCKYCTYDAVQSSTLRKHVQIRHKEYCRFFCIACKEFYCQEELTLAAHLDKKHGTTRRKSLDAYLNPHYMDDSNVVVKEYVQTRGRPRASRGTGGDVTTNERYGNSNPTSAQETLPSEYPPVKKEPGSPCFSSSGLQSPTSTNFPTQINYKTQTQAFSTTDNSVPSSYGMNNSSQSVCGSNNTHPSFPSHNSNLGSHVVLAGNSHCTVSDMVDFSSLAGEYKCNQCVFQTSEEQAFMSHLVTSHSGTAVVDPNGLNSGQSVGNTTSNSKVLLEQNDNPFNMSDDAPCFEEDLPTENDISELQLGRDDSRGVKPAYHSPLSTSLSSPVQSDIASTDQPNPNLTPSSQTSVSRLNDTASTSSVVSKDQQLAERSREAVGTPGHHLSRRTYQCRHCDIVFPDNILYAIHRGAHGFHQPFQCNLCGQDCGNKYTFASHLQGCAS